MDDLLNQLRIIKMLSVQPYTAAELESHFGISKSTMNRYLAECRHFGADIVSVKDRREHRFYLQNWDACKRKTEAWIDLQEKRNVTE